MQPLDLNNRDLLLENTAKARLLEAQTIIPMGLFERILQRIAREQNESLLKKIKLQLYGSLVFFAGAIVSLALTVRHSLVTDTTSLKFLSLVFTDFGSVLHNWQDYSFSLLENLPLGTIALILGAVLASIVFGDFLISRWRNFKSFQHSHS